MKIFFPFFRPQTIGIFFLSFFISTLILFQLKIDTVHKTDIPREKEVLGRATLRRLRRASPTPSAIHTRVTPTPGRPTSTNFITVTPTKIIATPSPIPPETAAAYITKKGPQLYLNGKPYVFTGVNAYSAATLHGINSGCGEQIADLESLFSSLRPNSVVRIWGWQGSMVTNTTTKQLDWSGLDRVLMTAAKYGQRVIISLSDQAGVCDDGVWKDAAWYSGGFMQVSNPTGTTPRSYWDFMQEIVTRYKDSPTIAMWEVMNEPETSGCLPGYSGSECWGHQTCVDHTAAANSLRYFFDTVGKKMKDIDHNHLIESGVMGGGQCGADNRNYTYIHESPYIDVASYHDYEHADSPMPGDQWNGLQVRLDQMKAIQKPLIIGEAGMLAQDNSSSCMNFASRRDKIAAKMSAQFSAGIAGYIPWDWTGVNKGVCNYDIPVTDPMVSLLHDFSFPDTSVQ
jgi:mannan endo-1,4-beta-mannosidase